MSPRKVEKPTDPRKSLKNILYLLKNYKLKLTLTIVCGVLSTMFAVIGPLVIGNATTTIYNGINNIMNHTGTIDFHSLYSLLILAVVLYIISGIFTYLQSYFLIDMSTDISYSLRKQLIDKVTHLSMGELDKNKRGDILSRITNDVDSLQTGINSTFIQLMTAIITIVGTIIMMLSINLIMTIATIIIVPVSFVVIQTITKHSQKYFKTQLNYKGKTNAQIEESFTGQDIIRVYNQEEKAIKRFKRDNDTWYEHEWKSQFVSSLSGPIMTFLSNLEYVVIAVLGAILVIQKAIMVGDILAFFQYTENLTRPIQQITRVMTLVQTALAATERIFEFLEIDIEEDTSDKSITDFNDSIIFENVSFGYGDEEIIKNISFTVNKGEKVAIVGETGAGKTTIVKLLMRFYDVNSGKIEIDGTDICRYSKNSLREMVGMVLQDTWLFNDTVKNNIKYGNLEASDEEIVEAAKQVHADEFIRHLPDGYDTVLNEDTDNISQGQKQLLTIARTVLSKKQILILDEATSSVDTRTEKLIQKAMDKLMKNKTSLVIAHRLSTIQDADKILVIDKGRIIEQGTHEELINERGAYYNTIYSQKEKQIK